MTYPPPIPSSAAPRPGDVDCLLVSIVSHGHGPQVQELLHKLAGFGTQMVSRVVLTLNFPEAPPAPPADGWPFVLQLVRNARPLGFGANHNRALAGAGGAETFVCVLNPDVDLTEGNPFEVLVQTAALPDVGCAYPEQIDSEGLRQDNERELPSPAALWRRHVLRHDETRVDWVNAACMVIPLAVWQALGGFDDRYFMYCEDVDLCLRMRLRGLQLKRAPVRMVHAGRRASRRQLAHLHWHLSSLLRLWRSPVYHEARQHRNTSGQGESGAS